MDHPLGSRLWGTPWWQDGPVFSTVATGDRIVALRPDQRGLGRLWLALAMAAMYTTVIVLASVVLVPGVHDVWSGLAVAGSVCAGLVLFMATWTLGDAASREETVGSALLWSATGIGAGLSALIWLGRTQQTSTQVKASVVLVIAAAVAFGNLLRLARGVRSARRQCAEITWLRQTVRPVPGLITAVPAPATTGSQPAFEDVEVTCTDERGSTRRLRVALRTSLDRAPLPGAPVLVWHDTRGAAYVEVDPDRPWEPGHTDPDTLRLRGETEPWWIAGPAFSLTGRADVLVVPPGSDGPLPQSWVRTTKTARDARGRAIGTGILMLGALAVAGLVLWLERSLLSGPHSVAELVVVLIFPTLLAGGGLLAAGSFAESLGQIGPRRRAEEEYRGQIARLRGQGARYPGQILRVPEPSSLAPVEVVDVEVGFDTPTGPRSVTVAMTTTSTRMPLTGSPVVVYVDPDQTGLAYVEPDPDQLMRYDLNDSRYSTSDSGGGGS